ncbi:calcitonin gene-related peptide type 1 receptor-like [Babylonia areolata]|uniref:calcitonin gene-related peptide type 1 receptor-like n=1 Tax=Babylonia areolata TaxID=304850 RepID=UPI003FCF7016
MDVQGVCRDRFGTFSVGVFQVWTCSLCYKYLFPKLLPSPSPTSSSSYPSTSSLPPPSPSFSFPRAPQGLSIVSPGGEVEVVPDVNNASTFQQVCSWLEPAQCHRWMQCCHAAVLCCQRQLFSLVLGRGSGGNVSETSSTPLLRHHGDDVTASLLRHAGGGGGDVNETLRMLLTGGGGSGGGGGGGGGTGAFCPQTWDGFSCVDDTPAGVTASVSCPPYLEQSHASERGYRMCTENGTWWTNPTSGHEWTDYTACVPMQDFHVLYVLGTVCNSLSILLLLPACIIFLAYRALRKQHRIRIHGNLFLSFLLTNTSLLVWEHVVHRDRLLNEAHHSNMHQNSVGCRLLYIVTRYAWSTAFFWMLVEGFHLYRLISRAFQTPITIWHYYVFGWGASLLPVIIYGLVRILQQHGSCWVKNAGVVEWIIYGPQLLCIVANVFFFIFILRILVTEIQSHPDEPSNYRRALKATFLLVPLFGLQLFLVSFNHWPSLTYEICVKVLSNSQGAVVAIIFCFSNSEVHCQLRHTFSATRCRQYPHTLDIRSITVSTHLGGGGGGGADSARGSYSLPKGSSGGRHGHGHGHGRYPGIAGGSSLDHPDQRADYIALHAWTNNHHHSGVNMA